jgi:acetolactate synthase-1/2/3 large subunit
MIEATGGEALALQLAEENVRYVFGVPGVQLDYAMDGLAQVSDKIQFIGPRHEQTAAYMADGYARSSGNIGVCMVVPGPGLLNASAALATAYACSSPVLCITGQIPSSAIGRGLGMLHEVPNQSRILDSVTKWHAIARTPSEIPRLVREAVQQLGSGRPRPVAIEIPPDVLAARAPLELADPNSGHKAPTEPDIHSVTKAAELLREASHPMIWVGWGVQAADASESLRELAEAIDAPVIMSRSGNGSLPGDHYLALNTLSGRRVLPECDVLLVVGSRFLTLKGSPIPTAQGTKVILVNAEEADLGEPRKPEVAIHGDADLTMRAIREILGGSVRGRSDDVDLDQARSWATAQLSSVQPQQALLSALRAALPKDGILVSELTQVGYAARVGFPTYTPRSIISPGYQGTLGYGFPTALGVKMAHPDRGVIGITGDGGFGWGMAELATAKKYNIGLVTVVFNDGAFGNVRRTQKDDFESRYIATDLVNPDYLALAAAFGITGYRANSPDDLRTMASAALRKDEPALIEVPVTEMPSIWHLL